MDLVVLVAGPVPPLACRMPTTRKGRPPIVIVVPIELASRPRSSAVVAPSTASRRPPSTAASFRNDALPDVVVADGGVVGGRADDRWSSCSRCRRPRTGCVVDLGRDGGDAVERARSPCASSMRQRLGRAGRAAGEAGRRGARVDRQQVRAEALELLGDAARRALADADQRDHRGDADDHAEHRQGRPQAPARRAARGPAGPARSVAHAHEPPVADVDLAAGRGWPPRRRG